MLSFEVLIIFVEAMVLQSEEEKQVDFGLKDDRGVPNPGNPAAIRLPLDSLLCPASCGSFLPVLIRSRFSHPFPGGRAILRQLKQQRSLIPLVVLSPGNLDNPRPVFKVADGGLPILRKSRCFGIEKKVHVGIPSRSRNRICRLQPPRFQKTEIPGPVEDDVIQ